MIISAFKCICTCIYKYTGTHKQRTGYLAVWWDGLGGDPTHSSDDTQAETQQQRTGFGQIGLTKIENLERRREKRSF